MSAACDRERIEAANDASPDRNSGHAQATAAHVKQTARGALKGDPPVQEILQGEGNELFGQVEIRIRPTFCRNLAMVFGSVLFVLEMSCSKGLNGSSKRGVSGPRPASRELSPEEGTLGYVDGPRL